MLMKGQMQITRSIIQDTHAEDETANFGRIMKF